MTINKYESLFEPGYYWIRFPGQPWEIALCAGDVFFIPGDVQTYSYEELADLITAPLQPPKD